MLRSFEEEIMDGVGLSPELVEQVHRGLSRTHTILGNHAAILRALRHDRQAVTRVLDIGCGHGGLMEVVRRQMGVDVVGVDLRPPETGVNLRILKLDAARDPLPAADVAVSVCLVHHLRDEELVEMIRNVGRACRRFVILDLVRNPVPLMLFSAFAPLCLPKVNVLDGRRSIRRAYTPKELHALVARALAGTASAFQHTIAPFWVRQMVDIRYTRAGA